MAESLVRCSLQMKISKPLSALYGSESSYGNISMEDKTYKKTDDILNEAQKYDANVAMEPVAAHTLYCSGPGKSLKGLQADRLKIIFDPLNVLKRGRLTGSIVENV